MNRTEAGKITALVFALTSLASGVLANGLSESRPWQFDTSADKANKAFVVDLIERKEGGFFDGFTVTNFNTTNIGSQVNCNNSANATGNIADNGQAGPSTVSYSNPNVTADSNGNLTDNQANSGGLTGGSDPNFGGSQDNSGDVGSSVSDSTIDSGVSGVTNGNTDQLLNNNQDNSGNQTAGVDGSTACNFDGATITGTGTVTGAPLNAPPSNQP